MMCRACRRDEMTRLWTVTVAVMLCGLAPAAMAGQAPGNLLDDVTRLREGVRSERIEIENDSTRKIDAFYYQIDYVEMKALPPGSAYFHAWYHHQLTPAQSY